MKSLITPLELVPKSGNISVIARNAYQLYISRPTDEETASSPLSGLVGYDAMKEAGVIADEMC